MKIIQICAIFFPAGFFDEKKKAKEKKEESKKAEEKKEANKKDEKKEENKKEEKKKEKKDAEKSAKEVEKELPKEVEKSTKEGGQTNEGKPNPEENQEVTEKEMEELEKQMDTKGEKPKVEEDDPEDTAPAQPAMDTILGKLPNCVNRDLVDEIALEFCQVNNKQNRKRLVKALLQTSRTNHGLDVIPYYARLVAILNIPIPEVGTLMVDAVQAQFNPKVKPKDNFEIEAKIKNVRFIGELTKFKVCQPQITLVCLKKLLDEFSHYNIDVACNLLETCGRFLYRSPASHVRTANLLEILLRKKNVLHLDARQSMLVENAYYQCIPPDRPATVIKQRDPMHDFVRKLIYVDLNKKNIEDVLRLLRKLPWNDEKIYHYVLMRFVKVWKVKYINIHHVANVASGILRYHEDFIVDLVDSVLEEIRVGLEENDPRKNRRRVAVIKYLGELYNYRVLETQTIFDTLYLLITFGHENLRPDPEKSPSIDPVDDFFRVRLVCTLLDTCGQYYDRGTAKIKLDVYLTYFQRYLLSKIKMPSEVEFMVQDTIDMLRPKFVYYKTYDEAKKEVEKIEVEAFRKLKDQTPIEEPEEIVQDDMGSGSDLSEDSEDTESEEEEEEEGSSGNEEEPEDVVVLKNIERVNQKTAEDEEFEREFSKMMGESLVEAQKRESTTKIGIVDVGIPMHLISNQSSNNDNERKKEKNIDQNAPQSVSFSLLIKRGNKQQVKTLAVPANTGLAVRGMERKQALEQEKRELKSKVLNYESRMDETVLEDPQKLKIPTKNAAIQGSEIVGSPSSHNNNSNNQSSNQGNQTGQQKKYYIPTSIYDKRR